MTAAVISGEVRDVGVAGGGGVGSEETRDGGTDADGDGVADDGGAVDEAEGGTICGAGSGGAEETEGARTDERGGGGAGIDNVVVPGASALSTEGEVKDVEGLTDSVASVVVDGGIDGGKSSGEGVF